MSVAVLGVQAPAVQCEVLVLLSLARMMKVMGTDDEGDEDEGACGTGWVLPTQASRTVLLPLDSHSHPIPLTINQHNGQLSSPLWNA